ELALGGTPGPETLRPKWSRGVAQRWLFPAPGTVLAVRGATEVAAGEGIALVEVRVAPGSRVSPMTSHVTRRGVVIAAAGTRHAAVERAQAAAGRVRIVTRPAAPAAMAALH